MTDDTHSADPMDSIGWQDGLPDPYVHQLSSALARVLLSRGIRVTAFGQPLTAEEAFQPDAGLICLVVSAMQEQQKAGIQVLDAIRLVLDDKSILGLRCYVEQQPHISISAILLLLYDALLRATHNGTLKTIDLRHMLLHCGMSTKELVQLAIQHERQAVSKAPA